MQEEDKHKISDAQISEIKIKPNCCSFLFGLDIF